MSGEKARGIVITFTSNGKRGETEPVETLREARDHADYLLSRPHGSYVTDVRIDGEPYAPTLTERIAAQGFAFEMKGAEPDPRFPGHDFIASLGLGRRRIMFRVAPSADGEYTLADAVNGLVSISARVENADGYEDWAKEFSSDPDQWMSRATYTEHRRVARGFRRVLGDTLYGAYLFGTENDI